MMGIRKRNTAATHLRAAGQHYDERAVDYERYAKSKSTPKDSRAFARGRARELRRDAMQCRRLANELEIK